MPTPTRRTRISCARSGRCTARIVRSTSRCCSTSSPAQCGARAAVPLNLAVMPPDARIRFIGVWDTVDAVGAPFNLADFINRYIYAFKFRTTTLDRRVECGRHALALDEEREAFKPVLWDETGAPEGQVKQVW